jgi:hypothetical protein
MDYIEWRPTSTLTAPQHLWVSFVGTLEEVKGLPPVNLNEALATPMSDIFNTSPTSWSFDATPAAIFYRASLPLPGPGLPCNSPTQGAWPQI